MRPTACPTPEMLARRLRAWLDGESEDIGERRTRMLMEWILANALAAHFGYFLYVINAADVPRHPTAEDETTWKGIASSLPTTAWMPSPPEQRNRWQAS